MESFSTQKITRAIRPCGGFVGSYKSGDWERGRGRLGFIVQFPLTLPSLPLGPPKRLFSLLWQAQVQKIGSPAWEAGTAYFFKSAVANPRQSSCNFWEQRSVLSTREPQDRLSNKAFASTVFSCGFRQSKHFRRNPAIAPKALSTAFFPMRGRRSNKSTSVGTTKNVGRKTNTTHSAANCFAFLPAFSATTKRNASAPDTKKKQLILSQPILWSRPTINAASENVATAATFRA